MMQNQLFESGRKKASWSTLTGRVLLAIVLGSYLTQAFWILAGHPKPGWFTDSVFYLALADFFGAPFHGSMPQYAAEFYTTSRYPPLFPLALALGGGGLNNWQAAFVVALLFGLAAILATYVWLHQQTRSNFVAAALLPLAILSPQYFFLHLEILSESQFITLLCLSLFMAARCRALKTSATTLVAIASLVPLSRSIGIALLLALTPWILMKLTHLRTRTRSFAILLVWLPAIVWMLYRRMFPVSNEYAADLLSAVGTSQQLTDAIGGFLPRLITGYSAWFNITGGGIAKPIASVILVLATIGWYQRIKSLDVDSVFIAIYLGVATVWPYPTETARLLAVTMPIIALLAYSGSAMVYSAIFHREHSDNIGVSIGLAMLLLTLIASESTWIDITNRASARLDPELDPAKRTISYFLVPPAKAKYAAEVTQRFAELVTKTVVYIGKGDCVWAPLYVTTGFLSGFQFQLRYLPQDIRSTADAQQKLGACRYLIVVQLVSPQLGSEPLYPANYLPHAKPLMVSRYQEDGRSKIAAALLDLRPETDHSQTDSPR